MTTTRCAGAAKKGTGAKPPASGWAIDVFDSQGCPAPLHPPWRRPRRPDGTAARRRTRLGAAAEGGAEGGGCGGAKPRREWLGRAVDRWGRPGADGPPLARLPRDRAPSDRGAQVVNVESCETIERMTWGSSPNFFFVSCPRSDVSDKYSIFKYATFSVMDGSTVDADVGAVAEWHFLKTDSIVSFVPDPLDDARLLVYSSGTQRVHLVQAGESGTLSGQNIKCASGPPHEADGPPRAIRRRPARLTRAVIASCRLEHLG